MKGRGDRPSHSADTSRLKGRVARVKCNREGGLAYFAPEADGSVVLTLLEETSRLRRTVRIAPGGRVLPQP